MTIEPRIEEPKDEFPVGMRVLAVDDDPTCLLLLEKLLRKCKYHVTTRTHAIAALNLLRENKNRFDLVISDVHMPDMDGFKLLELVGLELDLPVIMLSANGDPELVMKGITHGACDYLLKPVRIEELQIIWQRVVRKKKMDPKASENHLNGSNAGDAGNGNDDLKHNKKRKDQVADEDNEEYQVENDDPSASKKPRVVWSLELHRKFVAAVNYLGVDKAVPKKILELMNVEKLTRENVASHLQKYRLYLRRIDCVQSQQANFVAALCNTDPASYTRISSLNGAGGFSSLSGSPQFQNAAFRSLQPNGMLSRLNSPTSLGIQRLPSTLQVNNSHISGLSGQVTDQSTAMLLGNSHGHILKGTPMSYGTMPSMLDNLTVLETKPSTGSFNISHVASPTNPLMLQGHPVQSLSRVGIGNQPTASSSYSSFSNIQDISPQLDGGPSINELPLSVTDYQYQGADTINIGHDGKQLWDSFSADPIDSSNLSPGLVNLVNSSNFHHPASTQYEQTTYQNTKGISEFSGVGKQSYINQPPKNVGSLEDLVSCMMK